MREDTDSRLKRINKVRKKINNGRIINRDIIHVFVFFAVIFTALILYLVYFLGFQASSVINNSYNHRTDTLTKTVIRGSILADDGTKLAYSYLDSDGNERRVYRYGNVFAHVVGFDSNGRQGLESSYNYYLLTSHLSLFEKISNEFNNIKNQGDDIQTTLKVDLQNYVYDIMGDNAGAVICMNPDTGEIYVMLSKPDFDPNYIKDIWDALIDDGETDFYSPGSQSVLLNRATQGRFTPGSTFKIFTLYEYYLENPDKFDSFTYDCKGSIEVGDTSISCIAGSHGFETLKNAFANSCNCAFGTIGKGLDILRFKNTVSKLLFDKQLPVDIDSTNSVFTLKSDDSEFDIMATAIGQGDTMITPMHLAMIISSIANEGVCMKPHLVKSVINPYGEVTKQFRIEKYSRLFTENEAAMLKSYLRAVVTDGTAYTVYPGNFVAYGKTGTAEKESELIGDYDHSWFAGWAENNENKLVVCVLLENMESSGTTAVYLSKLIFDYYFSYY